MTSLRIKRLVFGLIAVLGAVAVLFCAVAPGMAERSLNRHTGEPLPEVSSAAETLHAELEVADLHADSLLWNRDLLDRSSRGHVDLPRLLEGNVALQVFSAVIKTPRGQNYLRNTGQTDALRPLLIAQLWPPATWTGLEARAIYQAGRLHRAATRSDGRLVVVRSRQQLEGLLSERQQGGK